MFYKKKEEERKRTYHRMIVEYSCIQRRTESDTPGYREQERTRTRGISDRSTEKYKRAKNVLRHLGEEKLTVEKIEYKHQRKCSRYLLVCSLSRVLVALD